MGYVNESDRKIVDTGQESADGESRDYRVPEATISGASFDNTAPLDTSDEPVVPTGNLSDVGAVRNLVIEKQEVRIQPDGSAVVDVTISFDPSPEAERHELRISKI